MDEPHGLKYLRAIAAVIIFLAELYVLVMYPQIKLSTWELAFPYALIAPPEFISKILNIGRGNK